MALRLQEVHPALVHVPIAFLPLAVGADIVGTVTGDKSLLSFGRKAIVVAAAGAVVSAVTGLIAGEEVNVEGESRDMLMTHRNLNFVATVVASCMALWRVRRQNPNAAYLGIGVAGVGIVGYTGYLGGKLVSEFGAGVGPAKGVYRPDAPALGKGSIKAFLKEAGTDLVHGVQHMVEEVSKGQFLPTIVTGIRKQRGETPPLASGSPA